MVDDTDRMRPWSIEKASSIVFTLAYTVDTIRRLPERPMQDDSGRPTDDALVIGDVYTLLTNATKLLAYHVGARWEPADADLIRSEGVNGYARVAARYGLPLPPPSDAMPADDPRRQVQRTAWLFRELGSGWGWMYQPALAQNAWELPSLRRGFATEAAASDSAQRRGYRVAPLPARAQPMELGPLIRYSEGETFSVEQVRAFNNGELVETALTRLTPLPSGAQVELIGIEGADWVIRYQGHELIIPADTILWEQPPQQTAPALRLLLWRDMAPAVGTNLAVLQWHSPHYARWSLQTIALDRRIVEECSWDGATFNAEQQRAALTVALEAATAYAERFSQVGQLALCGLVGSGKSHLAFAIAYAAAQQGASMGYLRASALPAEWRLSGLRSLLAFATVDLLVLDDLFTDARQAAEVAEPLRKLIGMRQAAQRPTVFTSVVPLGQLPELVRAGTTELRLPLSDYRLLPF